MKYVYKIVAALGALSVIPLIVFMKTIFYKLSSTALTALFYIGQFLGNETINNALKNNNGTVPEAIADISSLYDLYNLFMQFQGIGSGDSDIGEKFEVLFAPLITAGVVLVCIVVCAIVTAIFAFAAKNNRKVIYSSIVGIGLSFMFFECFEGIAAPILNETISLSTILESALGGLIGEFEQLTLTTNFWFIPAVFGAVILWTVLYNYTLPENEKRERKLMLGEADEQ